MDLQETPIKDTYHDFLKLFFKSRGNFSENRVYQNCIQIPYY